MGSLHARFLAIPFAACCMMLAAVPVCAQTIYKCTDAQGDVTYQDRPCKGAAKQSVEYFAPPPPRTDANDAPPPPFNALPPAPTAASPAPAPIFESAPPKPLPVPPPIWFCTRPEDGTRYVSHDGATPSRWVPAGILGVPGKSLAQTYGPGGGGGVSAPGVKKVPITTAPRDSIAANLVEVHDECTPATLDQACEHLRDELSTIEKKLPHAFNDERATLELRRAELRRQLDGC
jgi:hypothetical protein